MTRVYVEWPCQNCGAMKSGTGSCRKCLAFDAKGADQFTRLAKLGVQTMAALVRIIERGQPEEIAMKSIMDAARELRLLEDSEKLPQTPRPARPGFRIGKAARS